MSSTLRARDLMRTGFSTIGVHATLGEAMVALRQAQAIEDRPNALMIVDDDGRYVGMLTAKLLIRVFLGVDEQLPDAHAEIGAQDDVVERARSRLPLRLCDVARVDVPVVAPDDRLMKVIRSGLGTRLDFVPVVDDGTPVGFAPITEVFQATASIALTPEHEGIRFDR